MAGGRYNPYLEAERQRAATARRVAAEIRAGEVEQRRNARLGQQAHLQSRVAEVDERNAELAHTLAEFKALLVSGLRTARPLDFASLKLAPGIVPFDAQGQDQPSPEPIWATFEPPSDGLVRRLVPGYSARREATLAAARQAFDFKRYEWAEYEAKRVAWLESAAARHAAETARLTEIAVAQHAAIDAFEGAYRSGDPEAVVEYFSLVLNRDELPDGFPHSSRLAYVKESRQLVVERQLPTVDVVPTVSTYRYAKSGDAITTASRPALQIKELYLEIVARLALRTLFLLFTADGVGHVDSVVLNCFVDTVSPETGQRVTPCLLTVRTTRELLGAHELSLVDPVACLKHLNAEVSAKPHELKAVRPIVNFNMVDHRFVDKTDLLSQLDQRPNLAELTPQQFEILITNLFDKMGLETRLTQSSRDGGVDCVAWDMRPVVGGKVIVQAKRYKHTVGVSAVRDLYGTVLNEGAAKGILISTSGYGNSSFEFAQNKPLQLIAGGELVYLLEEHTGVKARIEFPEEWVDPTPDGGEATQTQTIEPAKESH